MSGTDFFDDDLSRQRERGRAAGPADADDPTRSESAVPRPVADLNLTRMARYRKEVDQQAATAVEELEKLRQRQDLIEKEKQQLEEMRRKHDDFERGKREMTDHLKSRIVMLERREVEAQRLTELLGATRTRFRELLDAVEGINEESWPEGRIREELVQALGVIDQARMEYNKAMARIEAVQGESAPGESKSAVLFEEPAAAEEKPFGYWIKIGLAVSLPLVVVLIVALLAVLIWRPFGG